MAATPPGPSPSPSRRWASLLARPASVGHRSLGPSRINPTPRPRTAIGGVAPQENRHWVTIPVKVRPPVDGFFGRFCDRRDRINPSALSPPRPRVRVQATRDCLQLSTLLAAPDDHRSGVRRRSVPGAVAPVVSTSGPPGRASPWGVSLCATTYSCPVKDDQSPTLHTASLGSPGGVSRRDLPRHGGDAEPWTAA